MEDERLKYERNDRVVALAYFLETETDEIKEGYSDTCYEAEGAEYLVLTDYEADELHDEQLEYYIEECIMPEIPEYLRCYFDDERWKNDAEMDGRGHSISSYDGCEYEAEVNGEVYYIYRTN